MHAYKCAFFSLAVAFAGVAAAQTIPTTTDSEPKILSAAGVDFGGLIDGYYSANFNHPATKYNTWRNFDVKANSFALNFAKLTMQHAAEPVGFTLELAAGRAMDIFHATEPSGSELYKHLFQAFVSVRPTNMHGFQFDFGKFVTSAGAEPTETHLNWNYSRSLLYANGPYYHFGARTSFPITTNFSTGLQIINGWNNVEDNNTSKTMGFTTALTTSKVNWNNNYYVGNEKTDTLGGVKIKAPGLRHFYDTVLGINPSGKVSGLFNFDYGVEQNPGGRSYVFYGYSVAMRALGAENFAFSPRFDWYKDRDGFITGGPPRTLQEFTLTGDYKLKQGLLTRLEYRRDWSNLPFYDRGNEPSSSKSMNTVLVGFVVYFAPSR
jgi:hypothetical protein